MVGCVQGLIGSLKSAGAPPPPSLFRCTSFQVSIGCCSTTSDCGELGAGVSCSPAGGTFTPGACE
jgi:hypothetical protein